MSDDKIIRADQVQAGMLLDLEGDTYAGFFNGEHHARQGYSEEVRQEAFEDHQATMSGLEFEYALVEEVERETEDCVRIDTHLTSFGCPPYHTFKYKPNEQE